MFRSLFFAALLVATDCMIKRRCLPSVPQSTCSDFFNGVDLGGASSSVSDTNSLPPVSNPWPSTFPNARNLTLMEALEEFSGYERLLCLDNYCSYLLHSFLCIHYFPPCFPDDPNSNTPAKDPMLVLPCREVCEVAMEECLDYVYAVYAIPRPEHLNCTNFPERENPCNKQQKDYIVACPTPAVHFDFCRPFEEKKLNVLETSESVDVCVKITSTGSHDSLQTAVTVDLVFEDLSAKGGEDYFANCSSLKFGVGRTKGDRECCKVKIVDDCLVEGTEEFAVHAHVRVEEPTANENAEYGARDSASGGCVSGSGESDESDVIVDPVQFGGALHSTTGSVRVNITDDDVCLIRSKYCLSTKCNQRTNASKGTFARGNYTYAAHVELIRVNYNSDCVAIDVRIIECWELRRNHCPDVGTDVTVPTCPGCPTVQPLNLDDEFLIAGVKQTVKGKRMIVLPNGRNTGLFSRWKTDYATSVGQWAQAAVN